MACSSCSTSNGQPKGCKNNGTCGTDGCNKLTVFDWLSNMNTPSEMTLFDYVEVRFKNSRKSFYKVPENISTSIGDIVVTQAKSGYDVGMVTLTGELVRVQMKKKRVPINAKDSLSIYRKASQKDIDTWPDARSKEERMKVRARQIAIDLNLKMKISDIEFQGDASKATFYYTAEERVDFRQLIKEFAKEFSIRIEMRQIGFRQEAARLGGIGSCGRELCCSSWLTDFRSVNTSAARYQQLSLNPQKLAGQCGKLKCCLNYELDTYLEALRKFPKTDTKIYTEKGTAVCQKIDIFKGYLYYAYEGEWMHWYTVSVEDANEMIAMNKRKEKIDTIENYTIEEETTDNKTDYQNAVGQDSLTRFDKPKRSRKNNRNKRPRNNNRSKDTRNKEQNSENRKNTSNRNRKNKPQLKSNKPSFTKDESQRKGKEQKNTNNRRSNSAKKTVDGEKQTQNNNQNTKRRKFNSNNRPNNKPRNKGKNPKSGDSNE